MLFSNLWENSLLAETFQLPTYLFDFSDKTIPVILTNKTDSEIRIYKNTTLGSSELLSDDIVNNVSRPLIARWAAPDAGWIPKPKEYSKYNLQTVINSVDPNIHWRNHQQFAALANEITHVFFSSEWDLVKWDATSHRNDVYPDLKPIKIPNQTIRLWVNSVFLGKSITKYKVRWYCRFGGWLLKLFYTRLSLTPPFYSPLTGKIHFSTMSI